MVQFYAGVDPVLIVVMTDLGLLSLACDEIHELYLFKKSQTSIAIYKFLCECFNFSNL